MAKRIFTPEVKKHIFDEIDRRGYVTVDEVADLIKGLAVYDPEATEAQWYRDKARRLLSQRKNNDGTRALFASKNENGVYINIETCRDLARVKSVQTQLEEKYAGLEKSIRKARRRVSELQGQYSIFDREERTYEEARL